MGALNTKGVRKNGVFANISLYLKNNTRYDHSSCSRSATADPVYY